VSALLQNLLVGLIVAACACVALRALLPFSARVWLARRLHRRVPDRVLVWIAGRQGCEACGGKPPPIIRR